MSTGCSLPVSWTFPPRARPSNPHHLPTNRYCAPTSLMFSAPTYVGAVSRECLTGRTREDRRTCPMATRPLKNHTGPKNNTSTTGLSHVTGLFHVAIWPEPRWNRFVTQSGVVGNPGRARCPRTSGTLPGPTATITDEGGRARYDKLLEYCWKSVEEAPGDCDRVAPVPPRPDGCRSARQVRGDRPREGS